MSTAMLSAICWICEGRGEDGKRFRIIFWADFSASNIYLVKDDYGCECSDSLISLNVSFLFPAHTCFSMSRMVSSEYPSFAFLTCVTALDRTLLTESFALLLNCLAILARFSLCSRVTLQGSRGGDGRKERRPRSKTDDDEKKEHFKNLQQTGE